MKQRAIEQRENEGGQIPIEQRKKPVPSGVI
jgi:hypothetical protein